MSEKTTKTKYLVIAVVLIVLVIVGTLVFVATRRPKYQLDEAGQILTVIGQETEAVGSSWDKIISDMQNFRVVEITDDPSSQSAGIVYSQTAMGDIPRIKSELDSIGAHHIEIDQSLQALEKLQLPDWVSEYIRLMRSLLQKDGERLDKSGEFLDNLSLYYGYTKVFLEGMLAEAAMEQSLDDGIQKFMNRDYAGAREQFQKAMGENSEVQQNAADASKMIPFAYLSRVDSNRKEAEEVIRKYLSLFDLVAAGSYGQADELFKEANGQYEVLKDKRLHADDLMPEHKKWWSDKIDSIRTDISELTAGIEDLKRQVASLIEKNKG